MAKHQPSTSLMTLPTMAESATQRRLRAVIETKLTDESLGKIVDRFIDKASAGDEKAAEFVFALAGVSTTPQPMHVTLNQFNADGSTSSERLTPTASHPLAVSDAQRPPLDRITIYLQASGPTIPAVLASELNLPPAEVVRLLDNHPERFAVKGREYSLKTTRA